MVSDGVSSVRVTVRECGHYKKDLQPRAFLKREEEKDD
jgi:hypothetical protein